MIYSAATIFLAAHPCFSDNSILDYSRASATIMFLILGVGFLIAGVTMLLSLKSHFPNFYYSHRCFLWLACLLLTFPLFLRSAINLAQDISENFRNWFIDSDHWMVSNTLYLTLSTYIPLLSQVGSLIFGFLRKR